MRSAWGELILVFAHTNHPIRRRLSEIRSNQRAAATATEDLRLAEEAKRKEREERDALVQADAAFEREHGVTDRDLAGHFASKYSKYIPQTAKSANQPPAVENPVQVSDAPICQKSMKRKR